MTGVLRAGRTSLLLLAASLAAGGAPAAAQRSLEIESFDATIRVEEDGWIDVTEEIQVRFQGSWNGIFRLIPVEYVSPRGFSHRLFLTDVSVRGPGGEPYEYWDTREGHYRKLKIRVPDARDAVRELVIR